MVWQHRISSTSEIPDLSKGEQQQTPIGGSLLKNGQQAPRLLLSSPPSPSSSSTASPDRYLYDLTLDGNKKDDAFGMKLSRKFGLPSALDEHIFIGSSEGFLVSVDASPSPAIHVFNPLTGTHLTPPAGLPPPPPSIYSRASRTEELCNTWKTPLEFRQVGSSFLYLYNTKAILSPSLDSVIILASDFSLYNTEDAAFVAPLSASSPLRSSAWTKMDDFKFYEAIFHRGLLYGICSEGILSVYDIQRSKFAPLNFSVEGHRSIVREREMQSSLVASPDDLFMVFRSAEYESQLGRYNVRDWETNLCQVFRLTYNQGRRRSEWQEVDSIGGLAFFIGSRSSSLAVDVGREPDRYPSLRSNCIYFTDSWHKTSNEWGPDYVGDAGVWSLEQKKVHYIELTDGDGRRLNWPPPVWYTPPQASSPVPV